MGKWQHYITKRPTKRRKGWEGSSHPSLQSLSYHVRAGKSLQGVEVESDIFKSHCSEKARMLGTRVEAGDQLEDCDCLGDRVKGLGQRWWR